jgi:hypothetical protein
MGGFNADASRREMKFNSRDARKLEQLARHGSVKFVLLRGTTLTEPYLVSCSDFLPFLPQNEGLTLSSILLAASKLDPTEPFAEVFGYFGERLSVVNSPDNPLSSPKALLQHKSPNRNLLYQHLSKHGRLQCGCLPS